MECPRDRLEWYHQNTEPGRLLLRTLSLMNLMELGIKIEFNDLMADEASAMLVIQQERNRFNNERKD